MTENIGTTARERGGLSSVSAKVVFDAVYKTGREAIRASVLLNGGAAVALVALVGHLVSIQQTAAARSLWSSTLALGMGTFLATVAMGTAYLTALFHAQVFAEKPLRKVDFGCLMQMSGVLTILLLIASYSAFALGAYLGVRAIGSL